MSLQIAAQHLSSQGRGKDSTLVHMSPREVSSLNAIAKAHGGQLTTNPHTGLPEAGFLESILPMVAGAGLMAVSGGTINPMTAGLLMGGLGYATTGSLSKGLMMGMGAYGGAGMGEALAMQGVQAAAAPAAADLAGSGLAAQEAALAQQAQIAQQAALAAPAEGSTAQMIAEHQALSGAGANQAAQLQAIQNATLTPEAAKMQFANMGVGERFDAMSKGIGSLGKEGGFSNLYQNMGGSPMSVISKVGSAAAPAIGEAMTPKKPEEEKADTDMGQRYAYSPGYANPMPGANPMGQEQTYMNPSYRPIDNAEAKKIYGFADGGATADPAAPPVPTSYTAAQPSTPIGMPAPAFSIPDVNSMEDLLYAPESQGLINAYLNRPEPIDVQSQYSDYLLKTLNAPSMVVPNSGVRTASSSATTSADDEFIFDANTQRYVKNPAYKDPNAPTTKKKSFLGNVAGGFGVGRAAGGSISESLDAPIDVMSEYSNYLQSNYTPMPAANSGMRATPSASAGSSYQYAYNPSTQSFGANPNYVAPVTAPSGVGGKIAAPFVYTGNKGGYGASAQPKMDTNARSDPFGRAAGGSISDAAYNLGGYSDGGRLLRGPGDGVSDSIPAVIGKKQPARLADGEFVVPARIVSELGNGSTEAGARKLYAMMDRIQSARGKTVGKGKVAKNSRSEKYLPA